MKAEGLESRVSSSRLGLRDLGLGKAFELCSKNFVGSEKEQRFEVG